MNYREAADWIQKNLGVNVSHFKLREAVKHGRIDYTRLGHRTVEITEHACRKFIKRRTCEA